jgi:membrane-associated protease RseP (regulator of RpoE activity)
MLMILAAHPVGAQTQEHSQAGGQSSQQAGTQSPQDNSAKHGYLGVQLLSGALVGSAEPDGPAQVAGIQPGDLIVRFGGKDIKDTAALSQVVAETPAGKEVDVTVLRNGRQGVITVKLGDQATRFERAAAQQLGPAYAVYMTLQTCVERFPKFERTRAGLREVLKTKEQAFSHELTEQLWNTIAAQFQKLENDLENASDEQLAGQCERAGQQAVALIGTDQATPAPLRKKDF